MARRAERMGPSFAAEASSWTSIDVTFDRIAGHYMQGHLPIFADLFEFSGRMCIVVTIRLQRG